jgi:aryl-alcohol dehydrogenase-like predicted oxidoreductase
VGTMTFGKQNTIDEGVEQLQIAYNEYGINFLDTAEMYPVPTEPSTTGQTDKAVAKFLKTLLNRNDCIVATKIAGRSDRINWLPRRKPDTTTSVSGEQIIDSVDASLQRLQIDTIDLLQIHWPDRYAGGLFGTEDFTPSEYEKAINPVPFEEQLSALQDVIRQGKVKYIGVSNETPYGVCTMTQLAKQYPDLYPKIVSIQNSYSLVVRKDYEAGLGEACYHNNVGLLAYSPLASGTLTGKYRVDDDSMIPKNARLNMFPGFMSRYRQSLNEEAVDAYCDIALKEQLTPTQLALSWCYHNELVSSTIIGATTTQQLHENIKSYDIKLSQSIYDQISQVYKKYTDPTKARNNPQ